MDPDLSYMLLFGLVLSFFDPIYVRIVIGRIEINFSMFYWALVEYYPRSYVTPGRVVKFIRKCSRLETKRKLHWMTCLCHYFQVVPLCSLVIMLISLLFLPTEQVVGWLCVIAGVPIAFSAVVYGGLFFFLQAFRCWRIKKKDPKYATHEIVGRTY